MSSVEHEPQSKTLLIIGGMLMGVALIGLIFVVMGVLKMKSSGDSLGSLATDGTDIALLVPGKTHVELKAQGYTLWVQPEELPPIDQFDYDALDLPDVRWEIKGTANVAVSNRRHSYINPYVQVGEFRISQPGLYEVTAMLPEGDTTDLPYNIGDDHLEQVGEAVGAVGSAIGGMFQIVGGGICTAFFGVIGGILLIIHLATAKKPAAGSFEK